MSYRPLLSLPLLLIVGCAAPVDSGAGGGRSGGGGSASTGPVEPGPVDADAPEEFTELPSGLKYRIRRKGNGEKPGPRADVVAHYKGWLDDGSVFDSSYRRGEPVPFSLTGVIPGWTEGLQYVEEGGMIELEIPSDLGYGARGMPPDIPGGATLHFLVELKSFR